MLGLCLTGWTCRLVADAQQAQVRATFERDAAKIAGDTGARLQNYCDALLALKGVLTVHPEASRAEFRRFVDELRLTERYPGFQAIQFVRAVPATQLPAFEAATRREVPGFTVHPAASAATHFIIDYNEPATGNEAAFGLDLAALPVHLQALEAGRDSGQLVAGARTVLVQDTLLQPGFIVRAPVYRAGLPIETVEQRRAALMGFVAVVFRVPDLIHEAVDPRLASQVAIRIEDEVQGAANGDRLMYDSFAPGTALLPQLRSQQTVQVAQRRWHITLAGLEGGRYARDYTSVALIGLAGSVISVLIAALLMASGRSRRLARRLGRALEDQRAFQDSASVGIGLFTSAGIARCNRGLEELLGYRVGELAGQPASLLSPDGGDPFAPLCADERRRGEIQLRRKDGTVVWCLADGRALDGTGADNAVVWSLQDISDRKKAEAELLDVRRGLEHSLAELAREKANVEAAHGDLSSVLATLRQAQDSLILSEKMASLGSLVAGIAHELNTPIGNTLLTATALSDMVGDFEKQYVAGGIKRSELEAHLRDTRTACDIMTASLRRAADLITSFKQVAVDQTSDQHRRFDLCDVVRDTLATFGAQLRRANCEVRLEMPASVPMDSHPGGLGQVLSNLLNNALLHAFEGRERGVVTLKARSLAEGQVELVFADDGVGMPGKVLHQVFDPFFTTKMGQGGSGLGMNIVYNIVTGMLGGTVDVASAPDLGTTITMRMPAVAPTHARGAGAVPAAASSIAG